MANLTLSTRSVKPNYSAILSHRTTVSLETYPLLLCKWTLFVSWRSRWRLMPSFAFYSFTYMTTDGVKGLFLTQKRFVRHHFYWLRKWQFRSVFVRMVTLQRFFALLIRKGLNYCAITMIIQLTNVFSFCLSFFCQTFLTLSLSDMANRVQLSSPKEAEQYILNMVTTFTLCL